jgi:hypothetical protein
VIALRDPRDVVVSCFVISASEYQQRLLPDPASRPTLRHDAGIWLKLRAIIQPRPGPKRAKVVGDLEREARRVWSRGIRRCCNIGSG